MKIIPPESYSWVAPLARPVIAGETVDCPADVAALLIAQGWTEKKPARKPEENR